MSKFPENLFDPGSPISFVIKHLGVVPYRVNELLVYLDKVPVSDDPESFESATNINNWTIVPFDPSIPSAENPDKPFLDKRDRIATYQPEIGRAFVDEDDDKQIHLRFNTPLEDRVQYDVTPSGIRTVNCDFIDGATKRVRALVRGLGSRPRITTEDVFRDFDLQFFPRDASQPESTWRIDSTGDIGIQSADESLKKRIYRRIMTKPGGFSHLGDDYGTRVDIKTLIRSGALQSLANRVAEQARSEPDVSEASCEVRLTFGSSGEAIVNILVSVARTDRRLSRFTISIPVQSIG